MAPCIVRTGFARPMDKTHWWLLASEYPPATLDRALYLICADAVITRADSERQLQACLQQAGVKRIADAKQLRLPSTLFDGVPVEARLRFEQLVARTSSEGTLLRL